MIHRHKDINVWLGFQLEIKQTFDFHSPPTSLRSSTCAASTPQHRAARFVFVNFKSSSAAKVSLLNRPVAFKRPREADSEIAEIREIVFNV
ncbi:hypothetical protein KOW79_016399 [Hemibagrus wyckioides]|uniref:Uncharacterized protein n=1 Tax=Hemibagrus wyckioides TaxID=337641 RepID=A0A9D3NBW8_9TELE|nr:hypothetical protein KOW79_016399 [Hemibagrus wyckioides]